jgi:hypothetical protein
MSGLSCGFWDGGGGGGLDRAVVFAAELAAAEALTADLLTRPPMFNVLVMDKAECFDPGYMYVIRIEGCRWCAISETRDKGVAQRGNEIIK